MRCVVFIFYEPGILLFGHRLLRRTLVLINFVLQVARHPEFISGSSGLLKNIFQEIPKQVRHDAMIVA